MYITQYFHLIHRLNMTCGIVFALQCGENCLKTCFSDDPEVDCFVLDNHGYIIISKNTRDTGKFLGEINGRLMQRLVAELIYEQVNITDYQAVCKHNTNEGNPANILQTVHTSLADSVLNRNKMIIIVSF